jgi:hypothetical protein
MDAERRREIEARMREINRELGLLEPAELSSGTRPTKHNLEEMEELYSERERLLQELEKDC